MKNRSVDCSKSGNYAPLQSQPAPATKWVFGQLLTTVQTSLLHPLLARWEAVGRLPLGGSSVPHNPSTPAGELPLSEGFQVLTSLGSSTHSPASENLQEGAGISSGHPARGTWFIILCKGADKFICVELVQNLISRDIEAFSGI